MGDKLKEVVYRGSEDDLHDDVSDYIYDSGAKIEFEDFGIGHYEYWGYRGFDSNIQPVVEDAFIKILIKNLPDHLHPPTDIPHSLEIGECDGEHKGLCGRRCQESSVDLLWKVDKVERTGAGLIVDYIGEMA